MTRIPHRDSPAPWKVYLATNGSLLGVGDKNAGGVTDYQGGFWGSGANKRSNVNLVAAAPDLYEALERCRARLLVVGQIGTKDEDALNLSFAALAKARGEVA